MTLSVKELTLVCISKWALNLLFSTLSQFFIFFDMQVLRLEKSQVTTVGIIPNKRSQLARYCLVWGIRPVYGPTTVGQVTIKAYFTGCGPVHCLSVFFYFFI